MNVNYFFDSYSVIELLIENPTYNRFENEEITITKFNLVEIYWHFLLDDEKIANDIFEKFKEGVAEVPDETLKEAMKFRKKHKKRNLSYADCIGYIYALNNEMKFLTGDKEFGDLENVEFVR